MHESVLESYFDDLLTVDILANDVEGSLLKTSYDVFTLNIEQLKLQEKFKIFNKHLLKLCNDTLARELSATQLSIIAEALEFSEYFHWDENNSVIADTIFCWANPEINYPVTTENLKKWKIYIESGQYLLKI